MGEGEGFERGSAGGLFLILGDVIAGGLNGGGAGGERRDVHRKCEKVNIYLDENGVTVKVSSNAFVTLPFVFEFLIPMILTSYDLLLLSWKYL